MEPKQKKPLRLDKNGDPYPEHRKKPSNPPKKAENPTKSHGKPTEKSKKKTAPPTKAVERAYPADWFFFHKEDCPVEKLKPIFQSVAGLDVEIWRELQIAELTFPDKTFVDFEFTPTLPDEPALTRFAAENGVKTAYYVSVEPACGETAYEFLKLVAQQSGGFFVADDDELERRIG